MASPASIREFMTPIPGTIESTKTLAEARAYMKVLGVRHLPVVDDGRLVGLLSERELAVGEALGRDGSRHAVAEVMAADPFTCGPQAHLHAVATEMADHRYGSAVVVEREHPTTVLGVFTTVDALRALALYSGHDD